MAGISTLATLVNLDYCAVKKVFVKFFAKFFEVSASFFEVFADLLRFSDVFGPIGMHSDAFGSIWTFTKIM